MPTDIAFSLTLALSAYRKPSAYYPASSAIRSPGDSSISTPASTQREPSLFEHAEKQAQQRKPPKCSACGNEGHRRVSKACPLRYNELRLPPTTAPALAPTFKPPPRAPSLGSPVLFPTVTATMTTTTTTQTAIYIVTTPLTFSSPPLQAREPSPPQYNTPEAIYNYYKASREA